MEAMKTITKREIIYKYVTSSDDKTREFYAKLAEKINLGVSNTKYIKLTK